MHKRMARMTGCPWLMPVMLTTWEAEIGTIMVHGQPRQIVREILSPKAQAIESLPCRFKVLT
jgi:hypothetical protein